MQSEQINEIGLALSKAQAEIKGAPKDTTNTFFKSKYADLESVWDAVRGPLSKNNLAVIQTIQTNSSNVVVLVTTLVHSSGQWFRGEYPLNPVKNDPQGMGSATTYARRYSLAAMVGVTQTDDDGEAAMGRKTAVLPSGITTSGIRMDQPAPGDGTPDDTYRIDFGKFKGRTLEEVGPDELAGYIKYLETKAQKDGKTITGVVAQFIEMASQYIGAFENQGFESLGHDNGEFHK